MMNIVVPFIFEPNWETELASIEKAYGQDYANTVARALIQSLIYGEHQFDDEISALVAAIITKEE